VAVVSSQLTGTEHKKYALTAMNVCLDAYDRVPRELTRCILKYLLSETQSGKRGGKPTASTAVLLANELVARCTGNLADSIYELVLKSIKSDDKLRKRLATEEDDLSTDYDEDDEEDQEDAKLLALIVSSRHVLYKKLGLLAPEMLLKLIPLIELELAVRCSIPTPLPPALCKWHSTYLPALLRCRAWCA